MTQTGIRRRGYGSSRLTHRHRIVTGRQAFGRRDHDIDMADVVFGRGEAGCLVDCLPRAAWPGNRPVVVRRVVLTDHQKPCHAECGCVACIDDGVERVEPCQCYAFEGGLFADVGCQKCGEDQCQHGIDVH